jgi:asparagine synthase (glutamine-hydrolysing)
VGNPAAVVQLLLADYARQHVRVVLSGDGGEELFGGRMLDGLARQLRVARAVARLPYRGRKGLAAALSRSRRGRRFTAPLDRWGLVAGIGGSDQFSVADRRELLRDPDLVRPDVRQEVLAPFYDGLDTDPINAVLHAYLCSWLSDGSLVRADRTAAASGLDIRFPLLDREVVEMAATLPGSFKLRRVGGSVHTRWPLRSMLTGILPPPLVNRPKRGMPTPLDAWLYGTGRLFLEEWCARLRANRHQLWNVETLERLRRRTSRQEGYGIRLWTLFILECWLDEVVGDR